jgi:SpoIID/LytB domain protein
MCNTGCCQTYNGVRNVNDTVRRAVNETEDIVLVSGEGEIISTYYSAVAGGTTVSAKDAWVGNVSYLQSKATPWEDYSTHPNGTWTWSVSPSKLRDVLVSLGHSELKGEIVDIEVSYAENSEYANKIVFTDGNWESPSVEKVIEINFNEETLLDQARRMLYDYERRGIQCNIENVFRFYNAENYEYIKFAEKYQQSENTLRRDMRDDRSESNGSGASGEIRRSLRLTEKNKENGNKEDVIRL